MMEIERKFLLKPGDESWRCSAVHTAHIRQGYFLTSPDCSVRLRIMDGQAWLTVKGESRGCARAEYEYAVPVAEAEAMMRQFCAGREIDKTRYYLPAAEAGLQWEIDEYHGLLRGGYNAELEIPDEDFAFVRPSWLGEEVTGDPRYTNAALARSRCWPRQHHAAEP